ncbi:MAG TPA: hypothetical protein VIL35_17450 [Vicinamibacterales bacterium]
MGRELAARDGALTQDHWFEFEIDREPLPAALEQLESVLRTFPIKT